MLFIAAGVVAATDHYQDRNAPAEASSLVEIGDGWISCAKDQDWKKPEVRVISSSPSLIRLQVIVPGITTEQVKHEGKFYTRITFPEYGLTGEIGKSAIPVIREMFQVPSGAEASIAVVRTKDQEFSLEDLNIHNQINPVEPCRVIGGPRPDFVLDEAFYHADAFYPADLAKVIRSGVIRGCRFIQIELAPIMYNPGREMIKVCTEMEVEIRLVGLDMITTQQMRERYFSPPYEALFKSLFLNYQPPSKTAESAPNPPGYVIITPASYCNTLDRLEEWKTKKGFEVTVGNTSVIGDDRDDIHAYIESLYNNADVPPTYVVLAADTDSIPTYPCSATCTATDLYFVTMTDSSFLPDIQLGRLPAQDTTELVDMIDKILDYEQVTFGDRDWMNKFLLMIGPRNPPNGYVPPRDSVVSLHCIDDDMDCDTVKSAWDECNKTSDIDQALSDGRSLATYTDHGAVNKWNCPIFDSSDVMGLDNENKYPFVLSLACYTGRFDLSECFAETWIKADGKGAIAFWGGSGPTWFEHNDVMENGIYKALCDDSIWTVAGAADRGKWYLYDEYGPNDFKVQYHFEAYNIMGDPSIDLWMDVCDSLEVDYDPHIETGRQVYRVDVEVNSSGIEDAFVCLYKEDDLFKTGYTNSSGTVFLTIAPTETGTMHVTVTKHNCKPHEGTVGVWESLICGDVYSDDVVDSLDLDYLEAYLWESGPAPEPLCLGDVDCDGDVDLGDVVYLLNYLNHEGDPPCDECCD
jgi:gingipain R